MKLPILLIAIATACLAQSFNVASFNLRSPGDKTPHKWQERIPRIRQTLLEGKYDIIGAQEPVKQMVDAIIKDTDYKFVGVGRNDFKEKGEYGPIFYNAKRFTVLASGTFGLSEQPDKPGVRSWKSACPRMATWAHFKDNTTNREFLFYNTHLDHVSELARVNGIKLIVEHAKNNPIKLPMFLTGDFNAPPTSETIKIASTLLTDSLTITQTPHEGPEGTFHGYRGKAKSRIDFIFVSKGIKILTHKTEDRTFDKAYSSDHYPVVASVELEETK